VPTGTLRRSARRCRRVGCSCGCDTRLSGGRGAAGQSHRARGSACAGARLTSAPRTACRDLQTPLVLCVFGVGG
jgi:hypothetical protein